MTGLSVWRATNDLLFERLVRHGAPHEWLERVWREHEGARAVVDTASAVSDFRATRRAVTVNICQVVSLLRI